MNKSEIRNLSVTVQIGKKGVTDSSIQEIKKQLEKKKIIKVKILRSAFESAEKDELVNEIVSKTDSELLDKIGFVIVLKRK